LDARPDPTHRDPSAGSRDLCHCHGEVVGLSQSRPLTPVPGDASDETYGSVTLEVARSVACDRAGR